MLENAGSSKAPKTDVSKMPLSWLGAKGVLRTTRLTNPGLFVNFVFLFSRYLLALAFGASDWNLRHT